MALFQNEWVNLIFKTTISYLNKFLEFTNLRADRGIFKKIHKQLFNFKISAINLPVGADLCVRPLVFFKELTLVGKFGRTHRSAPTGKYQQFKQTILIGN
ncbi:MAG: hypothetical protein ACJA0S_001269 [Rickettsiales bacterium]|jgi:hypothetical protein